MLILFLLIIFLVILFFYKKNNNELIENFYTFYLPFYKPKINEKINLMKNYNEPYFKDIFNYKVIKIGLTKRENNEFEKLLVSLLIANSKIFDFELIYFNSSDELLNALNRNLIHYANASSLYLNMYKERNMYNKKKNEDNILFICNTYNLYTFILAKKKKNGIENLRNITGNKKIGMKNKKSNTYILSKKILDFTDNVEGKDYSLYFNENIDILLNKLNNDEIDILFYSDIYPSQKINNFISNNQDEEYILFPINNLSNNFFKKNIDINKSIIDLNDIDTFLPKIISNVYYYKYKPDFDLLIVQYYLLTNKFNDNELVIDIINIIKNNINLFNKLKEFKYNKISKYSFAYNKIDDIEFSNNAIKYYYDKGYFTNSNNESCKYLVGIDKCNEETLLNNGFI
jgi:hypothetical protein